MIVVETPACFFSHPVFFFSSDIPKKTLLILAVYGIFLGLKMINLMESLLNSNNMDNLLVNICYRVIFSVIQSNWSVAGKTSLMSSSPSHGPGPPRLQIPRKEGLPASS